MPAPIIVLTGSPGAGKTTVASLVADSFAQSAVVAGDEFHHFLRNGRIPPWLPESHQQNEMLTSVTVNAAAGYARGGWSTVLEGIFGPWFLPTVHEGTSGLELHYFVLQVPLQTCIERFSAREPDSSTDVVEKMHGEFAKAMIEPRHLIDGNAAPDVVAKAIVERIEQRVAVLEPQLN